MRDHKLRFKIRRSRVRNKISHTTSKEFRLSVHKSNRHIYVQLVNQFSGNVVASVSTLGSNVIADNKVKSVRNVLSAAGIGAEIGKKAKELGVEEVVFDKGGYSYHGIVKSVADAAREFLKF